MNIHPIFVHFPIALLTIYAVLEICSTKVLREKVWFLYTKFTFLLFGVMGAFVSLQTGEMAEHLIGESSLVGKHAFFASTSTYVFGILGIIYLVSIVNKSGFVFKNKILFNVWSALNTITNFLNKKFIILFAAIFGLICITITGALGGAIVYGPNIDPVVRFFYNLVGN